MLTTFVVTHSRISCLLSPLPVALQLMTRDGGPFSVALSCSGFATPSLFAPAMGGAGLSSPTEEQVPR